MKLENKYGVQSEKNKVILRKILLSLEIIWLVGLLALWMRYMEFGMNCLALLKSIAHANIICSSGIFIPLGIYTISFVYPWDIMKLIVELMTWWWIEVLIPIRCMEKNIHLMEVDKGVVEVVSKTEDVVVHTVMEEDKLFVKIMVNQDTFLEIAKT